MTAFVESLATQQLLPPWTATDAHRWCFVFRMDPDHVRAYLEKYFNRRYGDYAPYFYTPLRGPQYGLVSASYFPQIKSTNTVEPNPVSGGNIWDRICHSESYVAFPVLRNPVSPDGLARPGKLVWIQPSVYCDNDTIVFSAREIWGSDMFLATIDRARTPEPHNLHLDVGMIGVQTFSPRSTEQLLACLHINASELSNQSLTQVLEANDDLKAFVTEVLSGGIPQVAGQPPNLDPATFAQGVDLDTVKQFRDCYDMGNAIYRAIVASRISHRRVRNPVLYDARTVEVAFMWSDSLKEFITTVLGVDAPTDKGPPVQHSDDHAPPSCDHMGWRMDRVELPIELAFSFTADIDFEVLETLHTYGASA